MIRPSKRLLSTLEAITYIAYNSGSRPISSKEIAKSQELNARYLETIMQKLVRAGILRGVRGPRGGYVLAKERRKISLGEVCNVLRDGEDDGERPLFSDSPLSATVIRPLWDDVNGHVFQRLDEISLEDLCQNASKSGVAREEAGRMDFTI
ncbi:MAG: Rrf2 family transcriptional regulator [Alphaproteobacteria bacterium]|nr:Rrf2 family transcriptional regulator [Alphaproteobacteria bacterium]